MMPQKEVEHIEVTPGVCGGRPRIAGHRIRVQDIVHWHETMGFAADEIVSQFPGISLSDVYAALAYYHDHREEIRRDMMESDSQVALSQVRHQSKLVQKLIQGLPSDDSLSP